MTEPKPRDEVAHRETAREMRASIARAHAPVDIRELGQEDGHVAPSRIPADSTSNTASAGHAAKVSAAKGLVEVRRRTGRAIPDEVLQLAEQG